MNITSVQHFSPKFGRTKQNKKTTLPPPPLNEKQGIAPYIVKGMIFAMPIIGAYQINDNLQKRELTADFIEEYNQDDTKSLKVEDINDDNIPEYIIEKNDGVKCVYDYGNNSIYYDIDGEKIEKIR